MVGPAQLQPRGRIAWHPVALVLSALTTAAVLAADAVFSSIDSLSVSRAEAAGFDPSQLTPHGDLLWLLLHGAVLASVLTTVLLGVALLASIRPPRGDAEARRRRASTAESR